MVYLLEVAYFLVCKISKYSDELLFRTSYVVTYLLDVAYFVYVMDGHSIKVS